MIDDNVLCAFVTGAKLSPTLPESPLHASSGAAEESKTSPHPSTTSATSDGDSAEQLPDFPDTPAYEWISVEQIEMCRMAYGFALEGAAQQVPPPSLLSHRQITSRHGDA
jgi:hypothetical protein